VIRVQNRLDLKIQQFTTFFTFGLTNRIDISLAIPLQDIHMAISSQATIVDNSMTGLHSFQVPGCASPCTTASFSNFGTATGIGDLNLRVKGTAWKGEKAALALGTDIRLPTGDSLNFLGAGTAGIKPFVVWSYRSKISPHASAGFETNGSSVLSGDISTGTKERFPGQLTYSGGADMWITSWLTGAIDIVGQEVLQSKRTVLTSLTEPAACQDGFCTECPALGPGGCSSSFLLPKTDSVISQATGSYNITSLSLGARIRPVSNLLMTGNVLLKLNDGGLRSTAVPLLGISYTF
jgi:hypothetical protein